MFLQGDFGSYLLTASIYCLAYLVARSLCLALSLPAFPVLSFLGTYGLSIVFSCDGDRSQGIWRMLSYIKKDWCAMARNVAFFSAFMFLIQWDQGVWSMFLPSWASSGFLPLLNPLKIYAIILIVLLAYSWRFDSAKKQKTYQFYSITNIFLSVIYIAAIQQAVNVVGLAALAAACLNALAIIPLLSFFWMGCESTQRDLPFWVSMGSIGLRIVKAGLMISEMVYGGVVPTQFSYVLSSCIVNQALDFVVVMASAERVRGCYNAPSQGLLLVSDT